MAVNEPIFDEVTFAIIARIYEDRVSSDPFLAAYVEYVMSDDWKPREPFIYK